MLSLRTRILLALVPVLLGALVLFGVGSYRESRAALLRQIDREAQAVARNGAEEMDALFRVSSAVAQGMADSLGAAPRLDPAFLREEQRKVLAGSPALYGITIAFDPGATPLGEFADYLHREGQGTRLRSLAGPDYRYREWDWFREPLRQGTGVWAEPYLDAAVRQVMITRSAPIRRGDRLLGVVAADLTLEQLSGRLRSAWTAPGGEAYLVSPGGRLVASTRVVEGSGESLAALLRLVRTPGVDRLEMTDPLSGQGAWIVEQPLPGLGPGWSLVLSAPTEPLLEPLQRFRERLLLAGLGLALLLALAAHLLAGSLSRPIRELEALAGRYAGGRFDAPIPESSGIREIRQLSRTYNRLGQAILARIEEVRAATAEGERYRQELAVAAELQQSMLPKAFPPLPELADRLDLHGFMRPAREVGGDVFDFIPLPDGRLGLLVGDVSDKGAPAALFMAETRLLVRMLAGQGLGPSEVLRRANHVLAAEDTGAMFVTLAYLECDPRDGRCLLASAGHPAPLLRVQGELPREIVHPRALPLGALPGTRYETVPFDLPEGAWLVVYSDGLTEALSGTGEAFGTGRLRELLASEGDASSADLAARISTALQAFTAGAEPFDDQTLLVLHRLPGAGGLAESLPRTLGLELPADTACLALAAQAVAHASGLAALPEAEAARLALAVDEALANLLEHGPATRLRLDLEVRPGEVRAILTDTGRPFDFEAASRRYEGAADPGQPAGGIGLFLLRRMVDECTYEPGTLAGNRLVLVKRG